MRLVGEGEAVTQHKCGTCRYFEEGGFAGSGRCSHPLRKNIQQMVLVRKSELACRSDWADDLWEPKADAEPVAIARNPRISADGAPGDDTRQYTDRVTAVGVAPSRSAASDGATHSRSDSARVDSEPWLADRDSREADADSEPVPAKPDVTQETEPQDGSLNRDWREQRYNLPAREPRSPESQRSGAESASTPRGGRQRDIAGPRAMPVRSDAQDAGSRASSMTGQAQTSVPQERPHDDISSPSVGRSGSIERPPVSRQDRASSPVESGHQSARSVTPARTFGAQPAERAANPALPQGRSGWTEPFEVAADDAENRIELEAQPVPVEHEPIDVRPKSPSGGKTIPVQSSLRECCGTCRDFRPAEGGERGWCNNPYAFDHRQMVERNQLACRSTIGSWWIANDDWWLQRADVSHHGRPTPIVDELLRQLLSARAAGSLRKVNRG